jgi:hypothetical protein
MKAAAAIDVFCGLENSAAPANAINVRIQAEQNADMVWVLVKLAANIFTVCWELLSRSELRPIHTDRSLRHRQLGCVMPPPVAGAEVERLLVGGRKHENNNFILNLRNLRSLFLRIGVFKSKSMPISNLNSPDLFLMNRISGFNPRAFNIIS